MAMPTVFSDVDGTLCIGDEVVDGAPSAVAELRRTGCTLRFLTNTDTVPPEDLRSNPGTGLTLRYSIKSHR